MGRHSGFLNPLVAALAAFFTLGAIAGPAQASDVSNSEQVLELLEELRDPEQTRWQRLERQISRVWSRSGSASADLLLLRGREALQRGDSSAAIEHFSALIDHAPDFAEGYHARANAWFMAGRFGFALSDLQEALARNPNHFSALVGLGRIYEELRQFDAAHSALEAAAAIHPHRPDVQQALERLDRRLRGTAL